MNRGPTTNIESRALSLLGSGVSPEQVASALGVSPSRISQLLSDENFAEQVATIRYKNLQDQNERDAHYNSIEDTLLEKLEKAIPLMMRPRDILAAISIINGAKRRGQSAPEQVTNQQTIVNLILPEAVVTKFTTNSHNQVVKAGQQSLVTIQSGELLEQVEKEDDTGQLKAEQAIKKYGL